MSKLSGMKSPKVQSVSNLSKSQQSTSNALNAELLNQIGQPGSTPSGLQQSGWLTAAQSQPWANAAMQQGAEAIGTGISDPNQYTTNGMFGQNLMNYWKQQMAPDIMNRFSGTGSANSGGAMTALARESGNLVSQLGTTLAPYQLQQRGLNMQGGQALGSAAMNPLQYATSLANLGQNQYQSTNAAYNPWLTFLPQALNSSVSSMQGPSTLSQIGSTLSGLASFSKEGGFGSIFSDERIKRDIEPVGDVLAKLRTLKAYTYRFAGGTERQLGLIAQEVEKQFPEAVNEVGGIKCVNLYALVSILVAAMGELAEREVSYAEQ